MDFNLLLENDTDDRDIQFQIAECYFNGTGVEKDEEEARDWCLKAAKQGHEKASELLDLLEKNNNDIEEEVDYSEKTLIELNEMIEQDDDAAKLEFANREYNNCDYADALKLYEEIIFNKELGNAETNMRVAKMYELGIGTEINFLKAFNYYSNAAECGSNEAKIKLADYYAKGTVEKADNKKAIKLREQAVSNGSAEQKYYYAMSCIYFPYYGMKINKTKYRLFLEKAADMNDGSFYCNLAKYELESLESAFEYCKNEEEKGNIDAQYPLGLMYQNGKGVDKDITKSIELFEKASDNGNTNAEERLNAIYKEEEDLKDSSELADSLDEDDIDEEEDYSEKTLIQLKEMIEQNDNYAKLEFANREYDNCDYADALKLYEEIIIDEKNEENMFDEEFIEINMRVAKMCELGMGTEINFLKAFKCYSDAVKAGSIDAKFKLAVYYGEGKAGKADTKKAIDLVEQASSECSAHQKYYYAMSCIYFPFYGMEINKTKYRLFLEKAADMNDGSFYCNLAKYELESLESAFEYCKNEEEKGNIDAQYPLGLMYQSGKGVDKDITKCIELFKKASDNGNTNAEERLNAIYKEEEEQKRIEEQKVIEGLKGIAAQKRVEEEKILAEQKRVEEQKRIAEQKRVEEEKRIEEQKIIDGPKNKKIKNKKRLKLLAILVCLMYLVVFILIPFCINMNKHKSQFENANTNQNGSVSEKGGTNSALISKKCQKVLFDLDEDYISDKTVLTDDMLTNNYDYAVDILKAKLKSVSLLSCKDKIFKGTNVLSYEFIKCELISKKFYYGKAAKGTMSINRTKVVQANLWNILSLNKNLMEYTYDVTLNYDYSDSAGIIHHESANFYALFLQVGVFVNDDGNIRGREQYRCTDTVAYIPENKEIKNYKDFYNTEFNYNLMNEYDIFSKAIFNGIVNIKEGYLSNSINDFSVSDKFVVKNLLLSKTYEENNVAKRGEKTKYNDTFTLAPNKIQLFLTNNKKVEFENNKSCKNSIWIGSFKLISNKDEVNNRTIIAIFYDVSYKDGKFSFEVSYIEKPENYVVDINELLGQNSSLISEVKIDL